MFIFWDNDVIEWFNCNRGKLCPSHWYGFGSMHCIVMHMLHWLYGLVWYSKKQFRFGFCTANKWVMKIYWTQWIMNNLIFACYAKMLHITKIHRSTVSNQNQLYSTRNILAPFKRHFLFSNPMSHHSTIIKTRVNSCQDKFSHVIEVQLKAKWAKIKIKISCECNVTVWFFFFFFLYIFRC